LEIYTLNQHQADTMLRVANTEKAPIVVVLGASYEDDSTTASKLGDFAQDIADLVGLGFLIISEIPKFKEIALQIASETNRRVDVYTVTDIGKKMFSDEYRNKTVN
jgi:hypothetical protein